MRRAALALAAAVATAALPAAASAEELTVSMPSRVFLPSELTAVVGDTVTWVNSSSESHDVTAQGGAFASGGIGADSRFSHRADALGSFAYVCAIHSTTMTGRLDVVPVLLEPPPATITPGETAVLSGRAPAGTAQVALEEVAADGSARTMDTVAVEPGGRFTATVRPARTTAYRAVAANGASPVATVGVVDRVAVRVRAKRGRRLTRLRVRTEPARPGETVALELYSRERFSWRQTAHGKLDSRGRLTFTLRSRVRRLARVVLEREGLLVGRSAPLMTWKAGRVAPRPSHGGHVTAPPVEPPAGDPHGGH